MAARPHGLRRRKRASSPRGSNNAVRPGDEPETWVPFFEKLVLNQKLRSAMVIQPISIVLQPCAVDGTICARG